MGEQHVEHQVRTRIRLVLLDDHLLFRESLGRLLASEQDFELVAECTTPAEALKSLKRSGVDVILLDIGMAKEFIPCARKVRYAGKCLVIAREVDATGSAIVLKHGASGIFLASDSSSRLMQAIRLVASGEAWVDQKVIQLLAERYPHYEARWRGNFTEREQTVLQGVVDGLSNRKIGESDWRLRIHRQGSAATVVQEGRRPNQKSACPDGAGRSSSRKLTRELPGDNVLA